MVVRRVILESHFFAENRIERSRIYIAVNFMHRVKMCDATATGDDILIDRAHLENTHQVGIYTERRNGLLHYLLIHAVFQKTARVTVIQL